ncbi:MAG TPA: ATP-binding protein [Terriglobales bacterium]|nr:ATP-binding protein [Terriglobales bacterium]
MSPDKNPGAAQGFQVCLDETMPGDVNAIGAVVQRVTDLLVERGVVRGHEMEIALALQEALANAVRYGARNDPAKTVHVTLSCGERKGMKIVVRDPGPGFDPATIPSPVTADGLLSDHGRGLHMIRALLDEVTWENNGTEIHLTKF